jgi:hypothetical protein
MKNKVWLVVKILILVFIILWIGIIVLDYFNAKNNKEMKFCMSQVVHIYNSNGVEVEKRDGKGFQEKDYENYSYTYECKGLGYKVYRYNRTDTNPPFKAVEFGPFFIKERQSLTNR